VPRKALISEQIAQRGAP